MQNKVERGTGIVELQACQPRILLVEDDQALGRMLVWTFEERGAETLWARSCAAALDLVGSAGVDLALVDADLPDGDGVALAEGLAATRLAAMVVICTGRHGMQVPAQPLPAVAAILIKPVSEQRLLALLEEAASLGPKPGRGERPSPSSRDRQLSGLARRARRPGKG